MGILQIIRSPKGEEMVVLSRKEYDRLQAIAEDREDEYDIALADEQIRKIKSGETTLIPADVAHAIAIDGVNPVKAWRTYRGWTGGELAKKAKLARATLSQIETGKRKGTVAAYKAIAKALGITTGSLFD